MGKQGTPNRLVDQTSPYLLQHAYNPVDWYPWGPEALERARAEDKPILLSVGYAACHWCHVMAHESFEDPETAALMNRLFVCVKIDREERPDLDGIYMDAVQAMTGQGGWPMTVFLTPRLVLASRARSWSGRGRSWTVGLLAGSRLVRLAVGAAGRRAGLEMRREESHRACGLCRVKAQSSGFAPQAKRCETAADL